MSYEFTNDWFKTSAKNWSALISFLTDNKKFLEIGSYEGQSSVWIMEHMMQEGSKLFCLDTWEGGEEHNQEKMEEVAHRFHSNVAVASKRFPGRHVYTFRAPSIQTLAAMNHSEQNVGTFDFVYVDGSHLARDVLTDACLAWPLLKNGGLMVFDDYMWGMPRDILHRPKIAIDAFINIFAEQVQFIDIGAQVAIRKANGKT